MDKRAASRRDFLIGGATASVAGAALIGSGSLSSSLARGNDKAAAVDDHAGHAGGASPGYGDSPPGQGVQSHGGHAAGGVEGATFRLGRQVDHVANGFNPTEMLRDFDYGKVSRLPGGRTLREWTLFAVDKEIEVAPGVSFPAWTFNGRIPGPTLRCTEGDLLRVHFINGSAHPHTIHFHGIHPSDMDGVPGQGAGVIESGGQTTYEFDAEPFGMHLYHCHVSPLAEHIARGLYGVFIVDPHPDKSGTRPDADEMVMVQNGFDTAFTAEGNSLYAVNGIPFHYMHEPIRVKRNRLVRIYLANLLEYDPINSFHLHGNFFNYFPTGTSLTPIEFTDTIVQAQAMRAVLEVKFPHKGPFMFHAHKTEFADLGWMGLFDVE